MTELERLKQRKYRLRKDTQELLDKDYYSFTDLKELTDFTEAGIKYRLHYGKKRAKRFGGEKINGKWYVSKKNFNKYWKNA